MATLHEIEELIARMAMGDRGALSSLYAATSPKLFGITLRVLEDRHEAEDALQETFVKLWHNAGRYRSNGLSPMTWLITVARNQAIDRLRARRSRRSASIEEADEIADAVLWLCSTGAPPSPVEHYPSTAVWPPADQVTPPPAIRLALSRPSGPLSVRKTSLQRALRSPQRDPQS